MALENAAVLSQCILTVAMLPDALHTFMKRGFERAKLMGAAQPATRLAHWHMNRCTRPPNWGRSSSVLHLRGWSKTGWRLLKADT